MLKTRIVTVFSVFVLFLVAPVLKAGVLPKNFYKYDDYFLEAEYYFDVPFALLKAIAISENGRFDPDAERVNSNGTKDYGLMQINTIWLRKFGIDEETIKHPKVNIFVAAKILRDLIKREKYSWDTIGKYHSRTPKYKKRWIKKVQTNLMRIIKADKKYSYKFAEYAKNKD